MERKDLEDLRLFHARISVARGPEEFFGKLDGGTQDKLRAALHAVYLRHVLRFHPDRWTSDPRALYLATEVTTALNGLNAEAERRIDAGVWGLPDPTPPAQPSEHEIRTRRRTYRILSCIASGDLAEVYEAEYDEDGGTQRAAIKVARDASDNPRMKVERDVLQLLRHKSLPVLVEGFKTTDDQLATVLRRIDGEDAVSVMARHEGGVEQRHWCWMFLRLLSVLGYLHSNGVIHGHIEPGNVMVRGRDHNAFLVGLTGAVQKGGRFTWDDGHYSAPEVRLRKPPIPPSDLWSLGKTMLWLAGGDPATDRMPDSLDEPLRDFLSGFLDPRPMHRAGDAWGKWHELTALRDRVCGARRDFVAFV